MTRLSTIDGGFLLVESQQNPKHVGALLVFGLPRGRGPAWLRGLIGRMKSEPPGFPFDQRLTTQAGLLYGLEHDPDFDIDYHVQHSVLPRPGTEKQLLDLVARLHATLLDRERPLWEFHLIEGLAGRRFAFYIKVHHALGDGLTFRCWIDECLATDPGDPRVCPIWRRPPRQAGEGGEQIGAAGAATALAEELGEGLRAAFGISAVTARLLMRRILDRDRHIALPLSAPRTSINVSTGSARALSFTSCRLRDLRDIGRAAGGSINDVVMTLCDMAMSRYFRAHNADPRGPLVAYMPVNIRTEEDGGEGNIVSLLQVKLASSHSDALKSLAEVRESVAATRGVFSGASRAAVQYYSLLVGLASLLEETLHIGGLLPPVNNLVISNIPGSRVPLYLQGAELLELYPVSTLPPITALNVTACSYAGTMYFGLIAGRTAVPDLPVLRSYLDAAFLELATATGTNVTHEA